MLDNTVKGHRQRSPFSYIGNSLYSGSIKIFDSTYKEDDFILFCETLEESNQIKVEDYIKDTKESKGFLFNGRFATDIFTRPLRLHCVSVKFTSCEFLIPQNWKLPLFCGNPESLTIQRCNFEISDEIEFPRF